MEDTFSTIAENIALLLEFVSITLICVGAFAALYEYFRPTELTAHIHSGLRRAWLSYARWMLLGLEFTLAADVVRTTIAPTWNQIGQLAAIAVIRTFLNYFLERDLETAMHMPTVPKEAT